MARVTRRVLQVMGTFRRKGTIMSVAAAQAMLDNGFGIDLAMSTPLGASGGVLSRRGDEPLRRQHPAAADARTGVDIVHPEVRPKYLRGASSDVSHGNGCTSAPRTRLKHS